MNRGMFSVREKVVPYKIQNILEKLPETISVLSYSIYTGAAEAAAFEETGLGRKRQTEVCVGA